MDTRTLIASRIDLQLRRHLGQPVDAYRAVNDARYARDLLLVCEAMEGTALPQLACLFREAEEQITAARRTLSQRSNARTQMPYVPASLVPAKRPVSFGRER